MLTFNEIALKALIACILDSVVDFKNPEDNFRYMRMYLYFGYICELLSLKVSNISSCTVSKLNDFTTYRISGKYFVLLWVCQRGRETVCVCIYYINFSILFEWLSYPKNKNRENTYMYMYVAIYMILVSWIWKKNCNGNITSPFGGWFIKNALWCR